MVAQSLPVRNRSLPNAEKVWLVVGEERDMYPTIIGRISKDGTFFQEALKQEWLEGWTRHIHLPAPIELATLKHYLYWAETGTMPTPDIQDPTAAGRCPDLLSDTMAELANLYVAGTLLEDMILRATLIPEIIRLCSLLHMVPDKRGINIIYAGTDAEDPVRRLLVDLYVRFANKSAPLQGTNPAFLRDLVRALLQRAETYVAPMAYRGRQLDVGDYMM